MVNSSTMMIPDDIIYLNHASIGPVMSQTYNQIESINRELALYGEASIDIDEMIDSWDLVRHNFAKLINGSAAGVTITQNTASGLHIVADGLSHLYRQGQNLVITELEFTTNSYVWQQLVKRYNLELRVAKYVNGFNQWENLIDNNTILVCVSFVQFSNGYRANLQHISEVAHANDAYVVIDAIQGLGIVPFDVQKSGVDFIAAGAYKWLLGPMGFGYFYVKPELLTEMDSILVGWFSDKAFHDMSHHEFNPWEDARRFQQSLSPLYPALASSLDSIINLNLPKIFEHVTSLQDQLIEGLSGSSFNLSSTMSPGHRSGIIKLDHENAENIVDQLQEEKIIVSYRDGGIRISPHFHNTEEQIDILLTHLDRIQ